MLRMLSEKLREALTCVLPVSFLVVLLNFTPFLNLSGTELATFLVCSLLLVLGIGLFNLGADMAMTPMGTQVGSGLSKSGKVWLLLLVSFALGVLVTVAEPDLSVLAGQVKDMINSTALIVFVGIGVGAFLLVAILKILTKTSLSGVLLLFYMLLFALAALMAEQGKAGFLPLAFDSGGVTTGPITVPFLMALGVGIATTLGGKHAGENSFGLVALCSVGPILAVLVLGLGADGAPIYRAADYSVESRLGANLLPNVLSVLKEVAIALGPIVAFFAVLQAACLHLPKRKIGQIAIGILYTFMGLAIFLSAVNVGFLPIGYRIGHDLATENVRVLVIAGFILGLVVVLAEPAVHVLNRQVEEVTGGAVSRRAMLIALSVGVGISIALSMIRIYFGFSILYYLIPGYFISLGLSFFVPHIYTAIAFDSGGVASGPLTSGFILPLAVGACMALHGEGAVMSNAFGVVAMVAMTPLITIQIMGFRAIVARKLREKVMMKHILAADDEQIVNFM